MKVTMLLADAAQAADNKLYILGGGWSVCGPMPTPSAVAMKVEVPWDKAGDRHRWQLALLDADAQPVFVQGPDATERPILVEGEFELGRPDNVPPGTPVDLALAINVSPLPLPPGQRYVWELTIDGQSAADWRLGFTVRGDDPGPGQD